MAKGLKFIRLTIGTKLVGLIALLLITSIASVVWLSTRMFVEDNTALIQNINADTAAGLAARTRDFFQNATDKMRAVGIILVNRASTTASLESIQKEYLKKDGEFLAVFLSKQADNTIQLADKALSTELTEQSEEAGPKLFEAVKNSQGFSAENLLKGETQVTIINLSDGNPALAVSLPFIEDSDKTKGKFFSHCLTGIIKQAKLTALFGDADVTTSFLVDSKGKLIAHPEVTRVSAGETAVHLDIVKQMLEGRFNNSQTRYFDTQAREWKLGAYRMLGFAGMGVVAEVPEAKAFQAAQQVERRALLLAIIILSIAFLAGYVYSGTITWPIKQLVEAAKRISEGDFAINLKARSKDELAKLSQAFNQMAKGLEERDRVKATFSKFHNKEIAEKLLSGEVKLGGERREAVIFFSDVRGFTAMSESMEPEQVVEMLNEYMTRMVAVIRAHHGIVDKYVGDAIMALWGVPIEGADDAKQAVRACLEMRKELNELNKLRIERGHSPLKIGMGLNIGQVIAGNIGSNEKMEYTVIGDSVNLASRIESMTKTYGTDLLISKSIYEKVGSFFVTEACKSAMVKGKSQAIDVYKINGYKTETGEAVIVQTPYSSYQAEHCEKVLTTEQTEPTSPPPFRPAAVVPPPFKPNRTVLPPPFRIKKAA